MRQPQAIAKADAVTGNAARLVRGAHAVAMQGAGATADTDPPCPKARARLDRRRARVSTPERRGARFGPPPCGTSPGGAFWTPGSDTAATRRHIEAECPQRVPFRTQHPLGAVVNRPSVWSDRWIFRAVLVCTRNADSREGAARRKLTLGMNLSLDGSIAAPGDARGWSVPSDELFQW